MNRRDLLAATGMTLASPLLRAQAGRRPNVVLILADDLAYGDPGCYGGEIGTPGIDTLAGEGIRFTQGYVASPICSPSRVGITTGQEPSRHNIFSYLDTRQSQRKLGMRDYLDPAAQTIARTFKKAGYATGHFGKWHMGGGRDVGDAPTPQQYGFDESLVSFEGLGDRVLPPGSLSEMSEKLGRGKIEHAPKHELTRIYVDRALDFVRRTAGKPFFLQVWPNDVHDAYDPKPELMQKYERFSGNKYLQQFYAVLDEMDRQVARLVHTLDAQGATGNIIFVFLGDNGPTAWPRYYREGFDPPGNTQGLRGRKWSLYEGGIRVPFIVRWKGRIPQGRTDRETVVSSLDIFPTLCALTGVEPPDVAFNGEDLSGAFLGKPAKRRKDLFWEYGRTDAYLRPGLAADRSPNLAMRSGQWKALVNDDETQLELYDLGETPPERRNLAAAQPKVAARMKEQLLAWRRSLPPPPAGI